jgi:hypothetical protein
MTTYSVSDRMLRPVTNCLTLDVARRILDSRLDDDTQSRIDELARKANRGTLTEDENVRNMQNLSITSTWSALSNPKRGCSFDNRAMLIEEQLF